MRRALILLLLCLAGQAQAADRVVALDWSLAETLLGLGLVPLGVAEPNGYRRWTSDPALPPQVIDVGLRIEPNLELLQTLRPDLILVSPGFQSGVNRPFLERIAPTLLIAFYTADGKPYDRARTETMALAARLGREAAGQALLARTEAAIVAARGRLAACAATMRPLYLVAFADARHVRVFGQGGMYQEILDRLGLRNAWAGASTAWGFVTVGLEELAGRADAQLLYFEPVVKEAEKTLADSPLWASLDFVRGGRVHALPSVWAFGGLPSAARFATLLAERLGGDCARG
jgi:iron complex transport system substrate-binding protein